MNKKILLATFTVGSAVAGAMLGVAATASELEKQINEKKKMSDKHLDLYLLMNQWVKLKQKGINLSKYFEKNGYNRIAIYGMSYVGETLVEELKGTNIEVVYGIDRNAENIWIDNMNVLSLDDELEDVDAVVVTAISSYDSISDLLNRKFVCPIICLKDILDEISSNV